MAVLSIVGSGAIAGVGAALLAGAGPAVAASSVVSSVAYEAVESAAGAVVFAVVSVNGQVVSRKVFAQYAAAAQLSRSALALAA